VKTNFGILAREESKPNPDSRARADRLTKGAQDDLRAARAYVALLACRPNESDRADAIAHLVSARLLIERAAHSLCPSPADELDLILQEVNT
jgi:hypothetical protein